MGKVSIARTLRLAVPAGVKLESLSLSPEDFFVLSRVERPATVGEIIQTSGLGAAQTEAIVQKLMEIGALKPAEAPASTPSAPRSPRRRTSTRELRAQAQDRRKRLLAQQLGAGRAPTGEQPRVATPTPPATEQSAPAPSEAPAAAVEQPMAAANDPRVDPSLGLSVDQQRRLLGLDDARDRLTPFELLGLAPTGDLKAIREAFREASRRFHPDAHRGRELGAFRNVLSSLFAEAKHAYDQLQSEEVREQFVAVVEKQRAAQREKQRQREAAAAAAEELRKQQHAAQQAERRSARAAARADRERQRAHNAARRKIDEYLQAARKAEDDENLARAANNYRLALQFAPNDSQIRADWERTRAGAQQSRAKDAFSRAQRYRDLGHRAEAAPLFLEAAQADPTAEHLAYAADAMRDRDQNQARDLAIAALRSLTAQTGDGNEKTPRMRAGQIADLRVLIARAFIAAGQAQSARQQLLLVAEVRPKDPEVPALLKSLKVT